MKKETVKYPAKKQVIVWNDIRSGHKPTTTPFAGRMLYILSGTDVVIGGYEVVYEWIDGKEKKVGHFWFESEYNTIPDEEVTAWAYLNAPDFD